MRGRITKRKRMIKKKGETGSRKKGRQERKERREKRDETRRRK